MDFIERLKEVIEITDDEKVKDKVISIIEDYSDYNEGLPEGDKDWKESYERVNVILGDKDSKFNELYEKYKDIKKRYVERFNKIDEGEGEGEEEKLGYESLFKRKDEK